MTTFPSVEQFLSSGAKSAKFPTVGSKVSGSVVGSELQQQIDFDTQLPKFWPDGNPMLQLVVTIKTGELNAADDGCRRIFAKGQMLAALKAAVKASGSSGLLNGQGITVTYVSDGEARNSLAAPKHYEVTLTAGPQVTDIQTEDDEPF